MENELEEEKKQRAMAINARKKLEADLKQMEQQFEIVTKVKDDSVKQLRKLQVIIHRVILVLPDFHRLIDVLVVIL